MLSTKSGGDAAATPTRTDLAGSDLIRNEPLQQRSTVRLALLLDSAAAVVSEIGYERLTTALVAERAHSSIGTVYRYFPDRLVVLQALTARALSRFLDAGIAQVSADHENWLDAFTAAVDYVAESYRNEPGFSSLRFGDVIDLRPTPGSETNNGIIAAEIAAVLRDKYDVTTEKLALHVEIALTLADALLARAFAFDRKGDTRLIAEAKTVAREYLFSRVEE